MLTFRENTDHHCPLAAYSPSTFCFLNKTLEFPMKLRPFALAALAASSLLAAGASLAQTKWDLPTAYPATNFHTENITQFAKDVDAATGGKLKISVHANASLFKAPEIKRAVQSSQAQAGEILLANYANENPLYALDGVPFVAASYPEARRLYDASKPAM